MSDDELKAMFAELRQEITSDNQHFFRIETEALRHETQLVAEGVSGLREAVSREFTDIREKVEAVRGEVQIVAETLHREAADIRQELRKTAEETQAMIKFSHAELDRRVSRLEDALADLQVRVERLEGSTH